MKGGTKIALLSHRFGNIGHLFMAVGFEEIIRDFLGPNVKIQHFEQHHFFSIYPRKHWLRLTHLIPHGRLKKSRMFLNREDVCEKLWPSARGIAEFSAAVTCGGPSIVRGVGKTPEMNLMFHHQLGAFHFHGVPTFDCGVGSGGFPLENLPPDLEHVFDEDDKAYFRRLFKYSTVSTVRDEFAQRLWHALGREAHLIPCAAIASGRQIERTSQSLLDPKDRHILINYQAMGANNDWGQGVDVNAWRNTVRDLIFRLARRHKVAFLCHSKVEYEQAARVNPEIPRFFPRTLDDYAAVIRNAKAGVVSRIHAALPMAGIGLPVIGVGTDTRLGTLSLIGLKTFFVKEIDVEELAHHVEFVLRNGDEERDRLHKVRENTIKSYSAIFSQHFRTA